jgi:hypothetical protein
MTSRPWEDEMPEETSSWRPAKASPSLFGRLGQELAAAWLLPFWLAWFIVYRRSPDAP